MVKGKIKSDIGFYIGDVCYVLADSVYYGIWGDKYKFKDGIIDAGDYSFAVAGTAYGDGEYKDQYGNRYGVDAGVIGLVPLELAEKKDGLNCGEVVLGNGWAEFESESGVFYVTTPCPKVICIDTAHDEWGYDYDD